jgi:ribosomal protein L19E
LLPLTLPAQLLRREKDAKHLLSDRPRLSTAERTKGKGGRENAKKARLTKHIQDAEHLRPLREYLTMH